MMDRFALKAHATLLRGEAIRHPADNIGGLRRHLKESVFVKGTDSSVPYPAHFAARLQPPRAAFWKDQHLCSIL